jgi:hypothetical protein
MYFPPRHAWNAYKGFPMETAKTAYVYIVNQMEENGQIRIDGSVSKPRGISRTNVFWCRINVGSLCRRAVYAVCTSSKHFDK